MQAVSLQMQAVTVPTVQTFVARWIPPTRRSSALALLSTAFQVGTITALLTAPKIVASFGWEAVFSTFGALGYAWVFAWLLVAKDAPPLPLQALEEAAGAPASDAAGELSWCIRPTTYTLTSTCAQEVAH